MCRSCIGLLIHSFGVVAVIYCRRILFGVFVHADGRSSRLSFAAGVEFARGTKSLTTSDTAECEFYWTEVVHEFYNILNFCRLKICLSQLGTIAEL